MNLKTKLVLMMVLLLNVSLFAQDGYTLTGTVIDETSMPIPGANVVIQNTTTGTSTDFDGNFSIKVSSGDFLVFSSIGYATKNVEVNGQQTLNVVLAEDASQLEEVVVVGYGSQKKSHLTGAVAKVTGADVAGVQATRVDDAIAGKLPGVLIQNQSGEPGADPKIQIRAASSLSGNTNPLVVVDGFPISGSIATINPNDIQSLEVLKDAASAAIYGSRGANGVILVTTKKGRDSKTSISYNAYTSFSSKYRDRVDMLKTAGEWANELRSGLADGTYNSEIDPQLLQYRLSAYENSPDVESREDWLFRTGNTQSHDVSITGGSENVNVFASLGYQDTEGVALKQSFERINGRLNIDAKIGKNLKAGGSFNGFTSNRSQLPHDQRDLLRAYSVAPTYHTTESIAFVQQLDQQRQALFNSTGIGALEPTFDSGYRGGLGNSIYDLQVGDAYQEWHYGRNGNGIGGSGDAGPAVKLNNAELTTRTFYFNANTYLQYELAEGLTLKTVLGADLNDTQDYYYQGVLADARERTDQSDLDQTDLKQYSYLSETTLSYVKTIGKHDISAVAGFEFQNTFLKGTSLRGTNVPITDFLNFNRLEASDIITTERDETRTRRSVFGRIQYAFDDKYLVSASVRRDGDSRFGANERYEVFPAFSLGWNVHNESFWEPLSETVSTFKPRISRGSLGTASFLGSYDALSLLNPGQTAYGTGFLIPDNIANPDLTWQSNTETNYGIDLGFSNNRFKLSVDYYTSDITNMLLNQSVSEVFGVSSVILNRGDVRSSGLELELSARLVQSEDFSWNVSANLSTVDTEILSLGSVEELSQVCCGPSGRGPLFRNYVGGEIAEMWGYEVTGAVETEFIADPSRAIGISSSEYYVVDQNGDGEITEDGDYVKLGKNTPDYYWGLNTNMNYKNFDLSLQFQGSQGASVYNIDPIYWQSEFGGRVSDSFDANGDGIADASGLFYEESRNAHGAHVQDAGYLALRNLTLGYTLDRDVSEKIGLSSLRVYTAATNLLYVFGDDYTSYNPEGVLTSGGGYAGPTTYGFQQGASPIVRSFTLGLNVNF